MQLGTTDVSILNVRNILGYPSTDLGTLCSCGENYINIWSPYKPINYNALTLSDTIRNTHSGFKLNTSDQYLYYDPPVGGATSPYRLGVFRGYKSDAAKPSNATSKEDIFVQSAAYIPDYRSFTVIYTLPELETILKMASDPNLNLDTIGLAYTSTGVMCEGAIGTGQVSTDGKCLYKIADLGLSSYSRSVIFNIKRVDVSKWGAANIGNTFTIPLTVWLGSSQEANYKKAKIKGGTQSRSPGKLSQAELSHISPHTETTLTALCLARRIRRCKANSIKVMEHTLSITYVGVAKSETRLPPKSLSSSADHKSTPCTSCNTAYIVTER